MRVVLRKFDIDHVGVPRAQAAQFLTNGTGIAWVIEPYLATTIGQAGSTGRPRTATDFPSGQNRLRSDGRLSETHRELKADVAGYSRLMGADEVSTPQRLTANNGQPQSSSRGLNGRVADRRLEADWLFRDL